MSITTEEIKVTSKMRDLTGQRFGSLVALRPLYRHPKKYIVWEFHCDCGSIYKSGGVWVTRQHRIATNPKAPSCGCLNRETTREMRFKHGMSNHPLFWVWVAMVERCHNPKSTSYHKYGAKGVYVCDLWRHDSTAFIEWALANGWEKGLHLDKDILSHKAGVFPYYSPETCQFIQPNENCRSTKKWLSLNS